MGSYMNFKDQAIGLKPPATPPLIRQSSVYSLTFDEFQNTLGGSGKDFGSMNMDELLKNIWTAEESQTIGSSSTLIGQENNNNNNIPTGNLNRQGSLTLPRTISQKTVDEVWKELYNPTIGPNLQQQQQKQPTLREITLEEFLFRAGVVREDAPQTAMPNNNRLYSGVASQSNNNNIGLTIGFQQPAQNNIMPNQPSNLPINMSNQSSSLPMNISNNNGLSIGYQQSAPNNIGISSRILSNNNVVPNQPPSLPMNMSGARQPPQKLGQPLFPKQANVAFASTLPMVKTTNLANPSINNGIFQGGQIDMGGLVSGPKMGVSNPLSPDDDTSSVSPSPYVFNGGTKGRKSGTYEKAMERRHRRMIKNRESAARSRSRKQAYTLELEAEVEKLKELNNELRKKQDELMEMQKNQVVETKKTPWGNKRRCLRRTLTGPW